MASENFEKAFAETLKHEGLWADHPKDPGGATMKGVTLATFRRYKPGATKADLRAISDAMLKKIYRDGYWNAVKGDDLPSGVDFAVYDFAVNSGPARAAIYLQNIVGAAPDGKIGPMTIKAVKDNNPATVVNELCSQRLAFLERLSTWPTFGKGWTARVNGVRKMALEMAESPPAKPVVPPKPPSEPRIAKSPNWLSVLISAILALFRRKD